MMDLEKYFINVFANRQISIAELVAFSANHLGKLGALAAAGSTDYDEAIALTEPLFAALGGKSSSEGVSKALQKAKTSALVTKREEIHAELARLELLVQVSFPKGSETYIGIFPNGLTAFRKAPVDGLGAALDTLIEVATPQMGNIADLAPITSLTGQWKTMRGEQLARLGASSDAAELRREASEALRVQLFDNLLFLPRRSKGEPEKCRNYFSQHLLEEDEEQAPPVVP
jgi:hypothetical protein